jgi:hypothetical protein
MSLKARPPSHRFLAALAALVALGVGSTARSDTIVFDPDGTFGANPNRTVTGLDWAPGNAVSIGAIPTAVGNTFTTLYQAKLQGTTGDTSAIPGLNTTFEITAVLRFLEVVDSVSTIPGTVSTALFHATPNQSTSFLEIYYNNLTGTPPAGTGGVQSNDLLGTGFADGRLILSGQVLPGNIGDTTFTSQFNQGTTPLDQSGTNDRGNQLTIRGNGSSLVTTNVNFFDPNFFKTVVSTTSLTMFNTSLILPFTTVDPSITFFAGTPRAYTPTLGAVNGVNGPDFQFLADANQSFNAVTAVPEPGTVAMAFTGLLTVSLGSVRKLRRRSAVAAA